MLTHANRNSQRLKQSRRRESALLKKFNSDRQESILAVFQSLFADFVNLNEDYRNVDSARDFKTIKTRLEHEGLGLLTVTLPSLLADLFCYIEGGAPLYTGFKLARGAEYPTFLGRLFKRVYESDDAQSFQMIYQICVVFKKLRGPFKESVLRKETRKFVDTDNEVGFIDFTAEPLQPILNNARKLIETVFQDVEFSPGDLKPRPGPGATNTPVDKHLRFRPHVVYTHLDEEFDYLEWFHAHSWDPVKDALRYMNLPRTEEAVSRFKFVPKYLGKPRGICIEENEMQFFQQAIKAFMYDHLESHPATRGRINFRSQDVNRNLALDSSITNDMITIDMSSASDRVARELVYRLFWNTPLLHLLDTVSTRLIKLPDGTVHKTHKFAPMGSGVCFPIMAIVHWALIRSIIKLSAISDSSKKSRQTYVYGDDIILPSEAAQAVYDYLPLFGMKLNTDKSFRYGLFRESCGIHAYNGVNVTPVYVNDVTTQDQDKSNTSVLLSLIAKESQFYKIGFHETSRCIQSLVHKHFWLLPTVGSGTSVLGFIRDGASSLRSVVPYARKVRYNADLQTRELSLQVVVPRKGPIADLGDGDGYLRKLLTNADEASIMPGSVEELQVRRQWILESSV